jgi:hypothetical protein
VANRPNIKIEPHRIKDRDIVAIIFKYNLSIIKIVRKFEGAVWNEKMKFWYIPAEKFDLSLVFEKLRPVAYIDYSALQAQKNENKSSAPAKGRKLICRMVILRSLSGSDTVDRRSGHTAVISMILRYIFPAGTWKI